MKPKTRAARTMAALAPLDPAAALAYLTRQFAIAEHHGQHEALVKKGCSVCPKKLFAYPADRATATRVHRITTHE